MLETSNNKCNILNISIKNEEIALKYAPIHCNAAKIKTEIFNGNVVVFTWKFTCRQLTDVQFDLIKNRSRLRASFCKARPGLFFSYLVQ